MYKQTYLTLLCLCLWAGISAQTQTQYIGPANGNWFTGANWNNGLPEAGKDALIGGGTSVTIGSQLTVDFNIENFGEINVNATVINNGNILSDGTMNFSSTGTLNNFSTFQNNGTANFTGTLNNNPDALFLNNGSVSFVALLNNQGNLTNNGTFDAEGGLLLTQGNFQNGQQLTTSTLVVLANSTLTNDFGAVLNIISTNTGSGILVQGVLNNFGTINNEDDLEIQNTLVNIGTVQGPGDIDLGSDAQLTNGGTLTVEGNLTNDGLITNNGLLQNLGFINNFAQLNNNNQFFNEAGATFISRPSGTVNMDFGSAVENEGTFDNRGDLFSLGSILNRAAGEFENSGVMENQSGSVLDNNGTFTNTEDIEIRDVFRNDGTFVNEDDVDIEAGGVFTNAGIFQNENGADLNIRQDFFNETGAQFTNEGTVTVFVRASLGGEFLNNDLLDNQGDITIPVDGNLTNNGDFQQTSGNLLNEGTLENMSDLVSNECSTINNAGSIKNSGSILLKAVLFQYGTLIGNPVTVEGGYIHTALTPEAPDICRNRTFGADINGDVKVYASELVAFENFDSCENIVYLANEEARPVFSCSDIGSVLNVNLTLTTRLGDELTCTAEVTPLDELEPQFTTPCPADVFVTTDEATVAVDWTPPVAVDNCTPVSLTSSNNPGDLFSAGNTTVTYTATDEYGNVGTCGFNVIVTGLTTCTTNESPADNANEIGFNTVTLSWAEAPNAILYDVYLGTSNPPTELVWPGVPATSTTVVGLEENTTYFWYVVPRNLNGDAIGCEANVTQFTTALACDNVTDAGTIGSDQTLCNANAPSAIVNLSDASGGSKALVYKWQKTTLDPASNPNSWTDISNADNNTFAPQPLSEMTWFRRGAKRMGCDDFLFTAPIRISLLELPTPELSIQQPSCGQPLGTAVITNLPEIGYSSLNGSTPAPGKISYSDLPVGQYTVTIGIDGCETSLDFEIVNFYTPPVVSCQNITRMLSGGSVTIDAAELDGGSTGICQPLAFTVNGQPSLTLSCGDLSTTPVTLEVTDALGGTSTCSATITIEDDGNPTVNCQDLIVQLNGSGQASILPGDVFQNASDNCGTVNLQSVQPNSFDCDDLGTNQVVLSALDGSGNPATCTATVTVQDKVAPVLLCQNTSVQLGTNGQVTIQPEDVFQSATDNCGEVSLLSVQPSQFSCGNVGDFTVLLTAEDENGNTANCTATVTVEDNLEPTLLCKNTTVQLGTDGQASISPADVFNGGNDNCGNLNLQTVQPSNFDCGTIGNFPVTLTASDDNGNTVTCAATVTVEDKLEPTVFCQNTTVELGADGQASIQPEDVFQSATDNCGEVALLSVQPSQFSCGNVGTFPVLLSVLDGSGNLANCIASVTLKDNLAPTVLCKNISIELDTDGQASIQPEDVFQSAADNCGEVSLLSVQPSQFSCGNVGTFPVLLSVLDGSGNLANCIASVTIEDNLVPNISCKDISVLLDENGLASIQPEDVLENGTDNCGGLSQLLVEPLAFDYTAIGDNLVTLTALDENGNEATCTAIVEVAVNENSVVAYTILANEEIHLHGNTVFGNAGVWKVGKEGKLHDNTTVNGFLKSSKEDIDDDSFVTSGHIAAPAPEPGEFKYNTRDEPEDDTKIPDNYPGIYVLQGNNFKKLEIGKNSTAKFAATGEIFINELKTKDADEGQQTRLLFSGTTELIVRKKVEFGKRSAINPDGAGCVKIYAEEDNVKIKERSHVNANIDARFKEIDAEKSKADDPTILTGQFIGKKVKGDDFVEWEWQPFPCGQLNAPTAPLMIAGDRLNLAATSHAGKVQLVWATNTEEKNDYFVIERSVDGVNFEPWSEVPSDQIESAANVAYREVDPTPFRGANFYRVQAVFEDGTSMYSPVRLANVALDRGMLTLFPNPAQHHVSMFWEKYAGKAGTVVISNSMGNPVLERQFESLPDGPVRFELGNLPDGLYWLMLKVDGHREISERFMVAKMD